MKVGFQRVLIISRNVNPLVGLSYPYHLDQSTLKFIFRGIRSNFSFLFNFLNENYVSKQNSHIWEAPFCGVTPTVLFYSVSLCPIKRMPGLYGLTKSIIVSPSLSTFLCLFIYVPQCEFFFLCICKLE